MTLIQTPTDEDVDLSDLDLLDDKYRHAICLRCYPQGMQLGQTFISVCGKKTMYLNRWLAVWSIPPNACPKCVELFSKDTCSVCGKS